MRMIQFSVLLAALSAPLSAQKASCAGRSDAARLACYDSISKASSAAPVKSESKASMVGEWELVETANAATHSTDVMAVLLKYDRIDGDVKVPMLVLRCLNSQLDVLLSWNALIEGDGDMTVRFDNKGITKQRWTLDVDQTALFYPKDRRAFIDSLGTHEQLVTEVKSRGGAPAKAIFALAGVREVGAKVIAACAPGDR